jgi:hypothetical protein
MSNRVQNIVLLIIGVFIAFTTIFAIQGRMKEKRLLSENTAVTIAEVSEISESRGSYTLTYTYLVGEKSYEGREAACAYVLAHYPVGSKLEIKYSIEDPSCSAVTQKDFCTKFWDYKSGDNDN